MIKQMDTYLSLYIYILFLSITFIKITFFSSFCKLIERKGPKQIICTLNEQ